MIENSSYKNADRILGVIYTYQDPIAMLNWAAAEKQQLLTFRISHADYFSETKENGFRSALLRNYRSQYTDDYSANQIELQLNRLEQKIVSHYPQQDDLMGLFPIVSEQLLILRGDSIQINLDKIFDWNGYVNKLDLNVFMGAFMACEQITPANDFRWYPEIDNTRLERQLASNVGLAENHAHLKAAGYILELSWSMFIHAPMTDKSHLAFIERGGLGKLRDTYPSETLRAFLRSVKFLRILLDTYLGDKPGDYRQMIKLNDWSSRFDNLEKFRTFLYHRAITLRLTSDGTQESQKLFERVRRLQNGSTPASWEKDIIDEQLFWKQCFECYFGAERNNSFFRRVLNLYLVCANYVKHSFIQSNRGSGFDRFLDAENLKSVFLGKQSQVNLESVFAKYMQSGPVTKLELRITPKKTAKDYVRQIEALKKAYQSVSGEAYGRMKVGLIIHFIKQHQRQKDLVISRRRFYSAYEQSIMRQSQTLLLFMNLTQYRTYQHFVVGIDTANLERENPPELFGNVYRIGNLIKQKHNFHFTYHVGESYNTLFDGLRHIFEVVYRLHFSTGDRLGHALALGQNVAKYYQIKRQVLTTDRQSFLDDIAWAYWLIKQDPATDKQSLAYLVELFDEASIWFEEIFGERINLRDYIDFYCLRGTDFSYLLNQIYQVQLLTSLDDIQVIDTDRRNQLQAKFDKRYIDVKNTEVCQAVFNVNAMKLMACYNLNAKQFQRGRETVIVPMTDTLLQLITVVQLELRRYLVQRNLSIEANPSSNAKISIAKHYEKLQFLQLNRYGLPMDDTIDFPVSINTDDSAIFQTMLPYEYALVGKALIDSGIDAEHVFAYLAYLQKSSVEQSFITDEEKY